MRFEKGKSGNPAGKKKGQRNKLPVMVDRCLLTSVQTYEKDGEQGAQAYFDNLRDKRPDLFVAVLMKRLPKVVEVEGNLVARVFTVRDMTADATKQRGEGDGER